VLLVSVGQSDVAPQASALDLLAPDFVAPDLVGPDWVWLVQAVFQQPLGEAQLGAEELLRRQNHHC
jgi:hypothetical protein